MSLPQVERTESFSSLKVAIVHYWFVNRSGAERVVEELVRIFPQADLFTQIVDRSVLAPVLAGQKITTSFLQRIPLVRKFHRHTLLLQPFALEQFDLSGYDLVISSESGPAKGVLTSPACLHLCYCHSPMRYIWDMYGRYVAQMPVLTHLIFALTAHWVRLWDFATAARVDAFASNSRFIATRIRKFYRRESTVIFPPVAVAECQIAPSVGDAYIWVGRLVGYKRVDLAVEACTRLGRRLRVYGEGPELKRLQKTAGPTVEFMGFRGDEEVRAAMAACRAFVCPAEEDFGITTIEVQAHGRPVIAFGAGGTMDTVRGLSANELSPTGVLFQEQNVASLMDAIATFEQSESRFDPETIRQHALKFDTAVFHERFSQWVKAELAAHKEKFRVA